MSQAPGRRGGRGSGPPQPPSRGGPPSRGSPSSRGRATSATPDPDEGPLPTQGPVTTQGPLVPTLQVNPSSVLSVQWDNRELPIVDALQELERMGTQQTLSHDEADRARALARTINGVLNRANNINEALHIRFAELSERLTRVFTQALKTDVQDSVERGRKFRDNIYRTRKMVNMLIRRGFATEYQLTIIVPSLFGFTPSRGIFEELSSCNTLGMSFSEVMNIAERSDPEWKKVAAASEANGKIVQKVDSIFLEPADFSKVK